MDFLDGAVPAFLVALLGVAISGLSGFLSERAKKESSQERERAAAVVDAEIERLAALANSIGKPPHRILIDEENIKLSGDPGLTTEIAVLRGEIAQIKERLPDEAVIDKVASINEALLAKGLENVQRALERLEDRTLTRWDVVTVVFAVLAAVAATVGAVVAITKLAS